MSNAKKWLDEYDQQEETLHLVDMRGAAKIIRTLLTDRDALVRYVKLYIEWTNFALDPLSDGKDESKLGRVVSDVWDALSQELKDEINDSG